MPEPIKWKSKIILVKIEPGANYGVDAVPTALLNAMLMTDVQLQPMEGEDVSRNLELPYLAAQEEIPTAFRAVLTGSVELVGSGTAGTAPAWGPLMRACGAAEVVTAGTSVEYSPVSDNHESVTGSIMIGPWRHLILGGRGTAVLSFNAQGIPVARFTITALFVQPSDQTRPASVDLSKFLGPQVATKGNTPTFTIGAVPFVLRSYELNLGNDVQPRLLIGTERIIIVDRNETLAVTVEGQPYAAYNPFAIAEARTRQSVVIQHGTVAGRRVTVTTAQAQQKRPAGISQQQNIVEWPLNFIPLPTTAGNDQWKVTLT